jgi:hypothetical protein
LGDWLATLGDDDGFAVNHLTEDLGKALIGVACGNREHPRLPSE